MQQSQALSIASSKFTNSTSPQLDAEVLLAWATGKTKEELAASPQEELLPKQEKKFTQAIKRRQTGEPIAYITGQKEFFGLDFFVSKDVLIPRPETEILVEHIIKQAKPGETVADIGTGSGCIAASIAVHRDDVKILASDISKAALKIASRNIKRLKVIVKLLSGDLLEPVKKYAPDIIVANLPYVDANRWEKTNAAQIGLAFEPKIALFGGSFGLEVYIRFIQQLSDLPKKPRLVMIEVDPEQIDALADLIKPLFPSADIETKKDLAGLDRFMILHM